MFKSATLKLDLLVDEPIEDLEAFIDELFYGMSNKKPDPKRTRSEMGSSDIEDTTLQDIQKSSTSIKDQLQKLDLLDKLAKDVEDLKQSVEFNNCLIETLKADNASLRSEVNTLKRLTNDLLDDNARMANDILDLQCRSMRDNVIIHGMPEVKGKTYQKTEELVMSFLVDNLRMKTEEATSIRPSPRKTQRQTAKAPSYLG